MPTPNLTFAKLLEANETILLVAKRFGIRNFRQLVQEFLDFFQLQVCRIFGKLAGPIDETALRENFPLVRDPPDQPVEKALENKGD